MTKQIIVHLRSSCCVKRMYACPYCVGMFIKDRSILNPLWCNRSWFVPRTRHNGRWKILRMSGL